MYQPYLLKYDYNALGPHISKRTMEAHYNNHYLKYLRKLNEVLEKNNFQYNYPVERLFENIDVFPIEDRDDILYNAGGVVNHELYFEQLSPNPVTVIPEPLHSALVEKFGSISQFLEQFQLLANNLPGSGYTFLAIKPDKELILFSLHNQDTPYVLGMVPIFTVDVWEHAYYLDQGNNRKTYLEEFLKVVNYDVVNRKYRNIIE